MIKQIEIFTVEFKNFYTNHAKDANESLTFTYSAVVNEKANQWYKYIYQQSRS